MSTKTFRELVNNNVSYQSKLRDRQITYLGLLVDLDILNIEDQLDEFGDETRISGTTTIKINVIPRYDHYYQIINLLGGSDIDNELPLEVEARVSDYIPNQSILYLPVCLADNSDTRVEPWKVIDSEMKYIEKMYCRILKCVPDRISNNG